MTPIHNSQVPLFYRGMAKCHSSRWVDIYAHLQDQVHCATQNAYDYAIRLFGCLKEVPPRLARMSAAAAVPSLMWEFLLKWHE